MFELAPGLLLGTSVRLVQKLGEGGMGSVWVAEHLALRTQVAVKFLAPHMAQDAAAASRFRREATAAARVKSPHIVQIFDHGMSDDFGPYIVMELLDGETVSSFVRRHGKLTPRVTAEIVGQLCKALGKAHALGIVHRDIKPDNVFLIDPEREIFVKVLDFGIAKSLHEELHVTSTGTMMGTPHYMSPEQMLSSKHVDFRADLWAVAVLTYHCLTGDVPFDGETFGAIAIAVAQGSFAPPYQLRGVGSPALDAWFVRALSRDPNARFSSASELSETLSAAVANQAAADGAPAVTSAQGLPGARLSDSGAQSSMALTAPTFTGVANTLNRPGRGRKVALALAGAGFAVLGVALAVVLLWNGRQQPDVETERTSATASPSPSPSAPVLVAPTAVSAPLPAAPPPSAAPPSASPPASVVPPKPAPVRPAPAPVKPKPKPPAGDVAPRPERPDRGF